MLCLFLWLHGVCTGGAPLQEELRKDPPGWEGPLGNDCLLPVSEAATLALRTGDEALARSHAALSRGETDEVRRLFESACESWRESLVAAGAGASVWFDVSADGSRRVSEGARAAVLRRLLALTPEERARWSERFEATAAQELARVLAQGTRAERLHQESALAEVERLHPLTRTAARAALLLCDRALEAGLTARALGWLERGLAHAEQTGDGELLAALGARRGACAPPPPPVPDRGMRPGAEPWAEARAFTLADALVLEGVDGPRGQPARLGGLGRSPSSGLAFLPDGRAAIQTPEEVFLIEVGPQGELELARRFQPAKLLEGFAPELDLGVPRGSPAWQTLPCAAGDALVLVVGRSTKSEPNALVCLEPPVRGLAAAALDPRALPRVRWAILGPERLDPDLVSHETGLSGLGTLEFQPGPVVSGERVIVQAREYENTVRAWILAFELSDGALAWKRSIAAGADLSPAGRFTSGHRLGSQPLAVAGSGPALVFAGTHLGAGALFETLDGEPCWTLKNRRRDPRDPGWDGGRPLLAVEGPEEDPAQDSVLFWAPADSDRMYALRAAALAAGDAETGSLLVVRPQALAEADVLVGGGSREILVLGSAGKEHTVSARRGGVDRIDALDLAPDERFRGVGLASVERVWACTNRGLYLFDREREMYLIDNESLPPAGTGVPGGEMFPRGDLILVVGVSAVWSVRITDPAPR